MSDHRITTGELADDLGWLEDHCRRQPNLARESGHLRLAAAMVRNVLGPFLDGQGVTPLHVAVVGGAGAGKSTIVNFLVGSVVADANPQAGYTRHPTAYISGATAATWVGHLGFLGPLRKLDDAQPANLDEDVYQVRKVAGPAGPLSDVVVWDCPDMTTWASSGYVPRLIEVTGLADVVVYVASDERYNDEVPTQFLHMLVRAGKAVVVVLTKMNEGQASAVIQHFTGEVLGRLPAGPSGRPPVPVLAVPYLKPEQLADPFSKAVAYRIPLINQVLVLADPETARRRSVETALLFLSGAHSDLLKTARQDLAAIDGWKGLVESGQRDFELRYRTEFLNGEGFRRFDEARDRLLELLELPGAARGWGMVLHFLRLPYRVVRNLVAKAVVRPAAGPQGESTVLENAFRAWIDQLRAEAIRRSDQNALWKHVASGFSNGLSDASIDQFRTTLRSFETGSADETESAARAVTANLEANGPALAILRSGKLLLDLAAVALAVWAGWFDWPILIYVPLFVSAVHQLVELIVRQYVEGKRSAVRSKKANLVSQSLAHPMSEWLTRWPTTGGSAYERLQVVLQRVPETIETIRRLVEDKLRA